MRTNTRKSNKQKSTYTPTRPTHILWYTHTQTPPPRNMTTTEHICQQILEMMHMRLYTHIEERGRMTWSCKSHTGQPVHVSVVDRPNTKLSLSMCRKIMKRNCESTTRCVFIVHQSPSHYASSFLRPFQNVQLVLMADIVINPTRHVLYDTHTQLSESEAQEFLQRRNLRKEQLPRFSRKDRIVQYFGWPPGSVVQIHCREILHIPQHYEYRLINHQ